MDNTTVEIVAVTALAAIVNMADINPYAEFILYVSSSIWLWVQIISKIRSWKKDKKEHE